MTAQFSQAGIPAMLVTGETDATTRQNARHQLETRQINIIVTVDLYNEGVDLPFVDRTLCFC